MGGLIAVVEGSDWVAVVGMLVCGLLLGYAFWGTQ